MGKNFSANNIGQRKPSDFYETPYSITQQLLDHEYFDKQALTFEPACGDFAITKVLQKNGFNNVIAYDIQREGLDFREENRKCDQLITNPPFSLAYEFILKAKEIVNHKCAFLLPLSYLHGQKRYETIYQDKVFPLKCSYIFSRYPMLGDLLRDDGKYRTGMMVYQWLIFDRNWSGEPVIRWISNQEYVLKKPKKEKKGNE